MKRWLGYVLMWAYDLRWAAFGVGVWFLIFYWATMPVKP